jgi:hypothetical protein
VASRAPWRATVQRFDLRIASGCEFGEWRGKPRHRMHRG